MKKKLSKISQSVLVVALIFWLGGCILNEYPTKPSILIVQETSVVEGGMQRYKVYLPDEENSDMGDLTIYFADSIGKFNAGDTLCFAKKRQSR